MPTRYIRPESHVKKIKHTTSNAIEVITSHPGTPKGTRTSITIGEVKGTKELQNTNGDSGLFIAVKPIYSPITSNIDSGVRNCCESVSLSTAAPIAANSEAYNR